MKKLPNNGHDCIFLPLRGESNYTNRRAAEHNDRPLLWLMAASSIVLLAVWLIGH